MRSWIASALGVLLCGCTIGPNSGCGASLHPYLRIEAMPAAGASSSELQELVGEARAFGVVSSWDLPSPGTATPLVIKTAALPNEIDTNGVVRLLRSSDLIESVTTIDCAGR